MKWANAYIPVGTITILVESFDAIKTLMIGGKFSLPVGTLTTPSSSFDAINTYRKLLKHPFDFSHVVVDVTTLHSETSASSPDLRHGIHQALARALIPTDADQWLRHHQDGSVSNIDGATSPEHLVTADDIGACLAVEVVPLDVRNRKGKLQKLFANDHKNISCDPKMQSLGHFRRTGYSLKYTKLLEGSVVVEDHKFTPNTVVSIPYGSPAEFIITDSDSGGADHSLKIDYGLRDTVVLILRLFIRAREEEMSSKRRKQVLSFTMHVFLFLCYLFRGLGISIRSSRRQQSDHAVGLV
ncbi:hypothetical protein ACLB2K_069907 [Fragaria x ananassa]